MKKIISGIVILVFILLGMGIYFVNSWFNTHYFVFSQPVKVAFFAPVEIKVRKPQVIEKKVILDYPEEIDTPIEKYICDKWGTYDCKTALAIFKAESGLREDAVGINTNNTIDVGIAQINSVHFKKVGCSLKELVDAYKNVDCAYSIWKVQGFNPWVAYNNGNYIAKLDD